MRRSGMSYFTAVLDGPRRPREYRIARPRRLPRSQGLTELADISAAITTEFENVPSAALADIALWVPVAPAAEAVAIAQDRAREKAHFTRCIACAPYAVIETQSQLDSVDAALLPGDRSPRL